MATKNGKNELQDFVKTQLQDAQKRFQSLEHDAEKTLKNLVQRGKEGRKDLEKLLHKVNKDEVLHLFDSANLKKLTKRAEQAGHDMRKRLDDLQNKVVLATGVASQAQVKELRSEINRLAKKVDALTKAGAKPEVRA